MSQFSQSGLAMFFTGGVSLDAWIRTGNLKREAAIYESLAEEMRFVQIISYRGSKLEEQKNPFLKVKHKSYRWFRYPLLTSLIIAFKNFREFRKISVIKTNQLRGYQVPWMLKKLFRKKLLVRCGYLPKKWVLSEPHEKEDLIKVENLERNAFKAADLGIVTSSRDKNYLIESYNLPQEKIKVVPNYVESDLFKPLPNTKKKYTFVYVGRAGKQKNLEPFLRAFLRLKEKNPLISLALIGSCSEDKAILEMANQSENSIILFGSIPNENLPNILNESTIFVLPSLYEGHPKSLLEAMSCGLACIGTRVQGIEEDIEHLKTGFLSDLGEENLFLAMEILLKDPILQKKLGENARNYILQSYSFQKIYQLEKQIIESLVAK